MWVCINETEYKPTTGSGFVPLTMGRLLQQIWADEEGLVGATVGGAESRAESRKQKIEDISHKIADNRHRNCVDTKGIVYNTRSSVWIG
jgi:hypothetical protein